MRGNGFDVDLRKFEEGIFYRLETTDKALPEILNKSGGDVALRAASFTKFATKASVHESLHRDKHLLAALTSLRLRGVKVSKPAFRQAMEKYEKTRMGGLKFLRSGWAPIAYDFGFQFKGGRNQAARNGAVNNKIRSSGKKATKAHLRALLTWVTVQPSTAKQESAQKIAAEALQKALNFVGDDMVKHAQEKLAKLYL